MIDVVIPIYNAYNALQNCLQSLELHQSGLQITLIDDASTDERVKIYCQAMATKNKWHFIQHDNNQGFVKTANEGLRLSQNHTILLNSDTIVSKNWVQALTQCATNCRHLGTATTWSNNAEICSLPKTLHNNPIPSAIDALGEVLFNFHQPHYPQIPTAVGFCMLISQQAKEKVGYFDDQHFGHGYGEENDYSMRVSQAGLKNVICDNAYVAHIGNQSFADFGLQPSANTMQRLLVKHPKYAELIATFIQENPHKALRKEIMQTIKKHSSSVFQQLMNNYG